MVHTTPFHSIYVLAALMMFVSTITIIQAAHPNTEYVPGTPRSSVIELTRATLPQALEDPANSLWLLKFYAPWCGHCKRMAPVLNEVAPTVTGKLAIGTIDCTVQKSLCSEYSVKGYPTLKYARDGKVYDYPGGRSKEDITRFAMHMSAPAVVDCGGSYNTALELVTGESADADLGVIFVAYHPSVGNVEELQSTSLTQVFSQVARMNQAFAKFCLLSISSGVDWTSFGVDEKSRKEGFIAKLESNVPTVVLPTKDAEELDTPKVLQFVKEYNVPLVVPLGPSNFNAIARNGRRLVMGAVNGGAKDKDEQIETMKKKLADYALNGPTAITSQYYFGWIDGKQWQKFLKQFDVGPGDLPQVIALDVPEKTYWQDTSYTTVKDFLEAIDKGEVEMKYSGRPSKGIKGTLARAERTFFRYLPWSVVAVVAVLCLVLILIFPTPDELRESAAGIDTKKKKTAETKAAGGSSSEEARQEGDESKKDK